MKTELGPKGSATAIAPEKAESLAENTTGLNRGDLDIGRPASKAFASPAGICQRVVASCANSIAALHRGERSAALAGTESSVVASSFFSLAGSK